jgi:class 3 adenylate cyclase
MATTERPDSTVVMEARQALGDHRWVEAFETLSRADETSTLGGADLEALAEAAWFTARGDASIEFTERAYRAYVDEGNVSRAAIVAFDLAREYAFKRQFSIASAWGARGGRLLSGRPEDAANAWAALSRSFVLQQDGEIEAAIEIAASAVEIGARHGDPDIQALGLIQRGRLLIGLGRTEEGFPFMEEATVAAVNGELGPFVTGVAYCAMIAACRNVTDYQRAGEWTEAAHRWCERQAINGFPGACRVHRAEIMGLQGGLSQAEQELTQATRELVDYNAMGPLSDGYYALGEIRLRMGDLAGAEEVLRQAYALGRSPHPALALIRLRQGNVRAASSAIEAAVREETVDLWHRARLLPAQVEIALAAGDPATARRAADELEEIASAHSSPALHAARHDGVGRALLAEGDLEGAGRELRTAIRHWREVNAPYEIAADRVALAAVLRGAGNDDEADLELETAQSEFERLGATLDASAVAETLRAREERRAAPSVARKTFMFTDIVGSTNLAEAMGDEAWEHLLRWHDDALRGLFARHGGEVVTSTGDGFFVAFDSSSRAVDCAASIQRALAEHRRTHGFAPGVRIGIHAADATRRGEDYSGVGVHVAARIAALAEGGQVLASAATANEVDGPCPVTDFRTVTLKGVTAPVDVVTIDWV